METSVRVIADETVPNPEGDGIGAHAADCGGIKTAHKPDCYKSEYPINISHEVRTPMNSIMGFAELALDSDQMPKIKDYLNKILYSAKLLLNIIESIVGTSKTEEYEKRPFGEDAILTEKPCFDGLVLVCDDNPMNQEVMCDHLTRVGLRTMVVDNGKKAVSIAAARKENGEKPFDLILMDIFMPVMDGVEAASKIISLETNAPIVAVTANIMAGELERYKKNGMPDCLGKPFSSQELWHVLLKYLTPIDKSKNTAHGISSENDDEMRKRLLVGFARNYQTVHADISEAVSAGDLELAHRLAHSLKGNAGLICKTGLRSAAAEIEALLKDRIASVWDSKMNNLNAELMFVLGELKPLLREAQENEAAATESQIPVDNELVYELLDRLEVMLDNINPECMNLLDDIRLIPGGGKLANQVEDFEFEAALSTVAELRTKLVAKKSG